MQRNDITCLFVDIGGVLLTDGWGHAFRSRAALEFHLDLHDLEHRHEQAWATHELGLITMDEYLGLVVFHCDRPFTRTQFTDFVYAQSQPDQPMLDLVRTIKWNHGVKVVVVSNEGRELNDYRIWKFNLAQLVDIFISSCHVHLRKPDAAMLRLALDVSQVPPENVVYIDNTAMHIQVAERVGVHSILHTDLRGTTDQLAAFGLHCTPGSSHANPSGA